MQACRKDTIEHTLRAFDRFVEQDADEIARTEKKLADFQAQQANRPFEHEERLKELLGKQAQLNAALDLDKSDRLATEDVPEARSAESFVERITHLRQDEPGIHP